MALASFGQPALRCRSSARSIRARATTADYTIAPPRLEERFGPARRARRARSSSATSTSPHSLQVVLEETVLRAGALAPRGDRRRRPLPGRRRGAQLRDERAAARPRPVPTDLGAAGGRRRRDRARRGAAGSTPGDAAPTSAQLPHGPRLPRARQYADDEIEAFLRWSQAAVSPAAQRRRGDGATCWRTTGSSAGSRGAWSSARGRWARARSWPRRSSPDMQARLNEIKDREDFRPVAPVVLEEEAADWFVGRAAVSPFMLFVFDVRPEKADRIPAVRHVDGTARIQTINRVAEPALLRPAQGLPGADRRAGARQHVVQHAGRADRLHAARRGRVLLDLAARRAGDRVVPAREAARRGGGRAAA